jgi:hypothetical protein
VKRAFRDTKVGTYLALARQARMLRDRFPANYSNLIILLSPGKDTINGGILSICSVYTESLNLRDVHRSEVVMCTLPGDSPLSRYTRFDNTIDLFSFTLVLSHFRDLDQMIINIPENGWTQFLENLSQDDLDRLRRVRHLHFNIMLQNIKQLPESYQRFIDELRLLGKVTFTTAHQQYSTSKTRAMLGVPLHKLSVYVSPEQYHRRGYLEKKNLLIVSPDPDPHREIVLARIREQLPDLRIQVIRNLTYEEYKKRIEEAKWSLTFGEGLDGYFVETIFSGGIGFAVYNRDFFTPDFESLRSLYTSHEDLTQKICRDIVDLDNEEAYTQYQIEQFDICSKHYDSAIYRENLRSFYEGKYTFE